MTTMREYFNLLRPKQWIKNFFVFAPLIFAKELFEPGPLLTTFKAFCAFCLTASSVYIINDAADIDADRAHPDKRHRPLAAGTVPATHAFVIVGVLLAAAAAIVSGMNLPYAIIVSSYFIINLAYSFKLKEVVLLDVFVIATGFILRVLGGAYAINVHVSTWIVLCTLFISLFLGFAKRRSEILLAQRHGVNSDRKVLLSYRVDFLDQMLTIAAAGTVISYALYTVAPRTLEVFGTDKMIYTTVFVLYGVFRYLYLMHVTKSTENPTSALTTDLAIIGTGVLWILTCIVLIYFRDTFSFLTR